MNNEYNQLFHCMICIAVINSIIFGIFMILEYQSYLGIFLLITGVPSLIWCIKNFLMEKKLED